MKWGGGGSGGVLRHVASSPPRCLPPCHSPLPCRSTHRPPHEQLLTRLVVGGASFGLPSSRLSPVFVSCPRPPLPSPLLHSLSVSPALPLSPCPPHCFVSSLFPLPSPRLPLVSSCLPPLLLPTLVVPSFHPPCRFVLPAPLSRSHPIYAP